MNLGLTPIQIKDDQIQSKNTSSADIFLDNDSVDTSGVSPGILATRSNKPKYIYKETFWTQFRALMKKNVALQSKQKATNLCQILIPILCLVFTLALKLLAKDEFAKVYTFDLSMPYFLNVPYSKIYNQSWGYITLSTCLEWYLYNFQDASQETQDYVTKISDSGVPGLVDLILPPLEGARRFYECPEKNKVMPYFERATNGTNNEQIFWGLQEINNQPYYVDEDNFGLDIIPDGAITFYEANDKTLYFKAQINDVRLLEYHRGNGVTKIYLNDPSSEYQKNTLRVTDGELILLDLMTRAYLYKHNPNVVLLSGSQYMPFTTSEETLVLKFMSIMGSTLYPVALSIIFPVFLYTFVLEKEERLREMMKMNGMKMKNYWIVNYLWNLALFMLSAFLFFAFGIYILKLPFFTETKTSILFYTVLGWGLSQVSLSFFFQNFLSKVRTATIIGYLLSIWTCIVAVSFNVGVYPYPNVLPFQLRLYPPFAFCRLIYSLSIKCSNFVCVRGFYDFDAEMTECLVMLYVEAIVYLVLGLYLDKVWPQEYGVRKKPFYFIEKWLKKLRKSNSNSSNYIEIEENSPRPPSENFTNVLDINGEDDDVKKEAEFVSKLRPPFYDYPLVIKNLRKVYKAVGGRPSKVAVEDFSLHIRKGEMFGLLGPNGAGKTSLISMLTGLYSPEAGNAWVGGYDIVNQIDLVHSRLGVCPQFDLLWPELTVEEHLLFYARIRGISKENERNVVNRAMTEVRLEEFAKFATKQLSGGMKRRLSVAIAFVGNPQIVLLDEPTTGLDPENRRQLWDILVESRRNRAMVLTTHSMEEADVLCTRIGIIVGGVLKCIGPQTRLKSKYGGGYQLVIHCHKDKYLKTHGDTTKTAGSSEYYHTKVLEYVKSILPNAVLKSAFHGSFLFQIPLEGLEVSKIFDEIEVKKDELAISDWGISQCTLEDVFMEIVRYVEENYND